MSSALFQPLLHDPLGWKQSTTTYNDTFKSRTYGTSSNKEKKLSPYGQEYQKQVRKQQQHMKVFRTNPYFTQSISDEQPTPRIIFLKKNNEEYREQPPASYQLTRSKTLPVVCEESPTFAADCKKQSQPIYREPHYASASTDNRGSMKAQRNSKEDKEKYMIDIDNDQYRHWLTYPTPDTPPQIVDIKQRLGQHKVPSTLSRAASASYASGEQHQSASQTNEQSGSKVPRRRKKQADDGGHFLQFNLPPTPPELRAARHRLEKYRYHQSLDNYPPRSENNQDNDQDDYSRQANASQYEDEQSPPNQTDSTKEESGDPEDENRIADYEQSTMMGQPNDGENYPEEYIEALEISDAANEEYYKNCKPDCDKRSERSYYRIPPVSSDLQHGSVLAYCNQQQPPTQPINYKNSSRSGNEFGTWIRNSTDFERESAMKILNDVLKQPTIGYGIPKKRQIIFKKPGGHNTVRTGSAARQLGHARNHQRIPCEICEKQLIKHHIWSLSRSKTITCPHQE
ncbi:hypothetical protein I4U23_029442 [Adineta vaga]|nr:hypothetical protein I4U23_029442 [Adineta vaga]